MKRLCWITGAALLLSVLLGIIAVGCGGGSGGDETTTTTLVADKYPVPTESYKIGVVVFGNADLEQQAANAYLMDYIGPRFNVEFIVSEDIDDADAELTFLENCAASGCKGILAYQTLTPKAAPDKCKELGMYYIKASKPLDDMEFGWAEGNPFYVGAAAPVGDYQLGYDCLTQFLNEGARKVGMATGGAESGNSQHLPRTQGAEDAIAEFEKANPGVTIDVTQFGGFSGDAFSASQAQMIASDPDAIFATFAVEDLWVQPLTDAGKAGVIKLGGVSSINPVSVQAMQDGTLNWWGGKYAAMAGIPFAMLYNWMTGYSAEFSDNGKTIFIPQSWIEITNGDEMEKWLALIDAQVPPYSADDIKAVCKAFNPDATLDDLKALALSSSYDDVVARRAAGN